MIEIMFPAFVASLILVGIHGYLGIHIIARGVIFVDLALAQVAAMGWALAGLGVGDSIADALGIPHGVAAYGIGLVATLLAAAVISLTRIEGSRIPHEAIIGIVYVVATAGTILLASLAPRGSEHVEQLLSGALLWVTWSDIWRLAIIYSVIGAAHWFLRHRFFTISLEPEKALAQGWRIRAWDFLFYALFGVVVTSAVAIAGVLVVFSFLVIPAVIAFLFTTEPRPLILIAWSSGFVASTFGLWLSFVTDLPTGPVIVVAFGFALVVAFGLRAALRWNAVKAE
ncbi:MAG: iron chelate uptake ABC transporter family permease subunit [Gemmatimonadales bacterium]